MACLHELEADVLERNREIERLRRDDRARRELQDATDAARRDLAAVVDVPRPDFADLRGCDCSRTVDGPPAAA